MLNQFTINNKHAYKLWNQLVKYVSKVTLKLVHEKFGIEVATKELGVTGWLYGKVQGWFE